MNPRIHHRLRILAVAAALLSAQWGVTNPAAITCRGMCDASAVVPLGSGHFVVADDEDNILRVYSRNHGGLPVHTYDLSTFLRAEPKSPEVDLEGAAPIGDRVYWISSHARNKNGKDRVSRRRLFATTLSEVNGTFAIQPVGRPYLNLLTDLLKDPRLKPFNLAAAARRAPKSKNALNIEGLCATAEGHLLIGFRNPVPQDRALIVPLLNPAEAIEGKPARLGEPLLLDLGGLGIRSLARSGDRYLIIAGSYDGEGQSLLFEWRGGDDTPRRLPRAELAGLNPEAIEFLTGNGIERLLVVSDDGTRKIDGQDCKSLNDPNLKCFRAITIDF
ncbi:MAG: DUF3616 domain-containing protein [Verrucomicrobiae bacterium]|nr:DUF3616 domain-containing protein [Verrucomicrobiae bacterium]